MPHLHDNINFIQIIDHLFTKGGACPRAFFTHNPAGIHKVGFNIKYLFMSQRVSGPGNHHQLIFKPEPFHSIWVTNRAFDKSNIHLSFKNQTFGITGMMHQHINMDLRMHPFKGTDKIRQNVIAYCGRGHNVDPSLEGIILFRHDVFNITHLADDLFRER